MVTAKAFIEQIHVPLNEEWGYIYGTWGSVWTREKQRRATRAQTKRYGARWIGKRVTDCSGLVRWALRQLGVDIVHHARYQYTDWCRAKGRLINGAREDGKPIRPGTLVFLKGNQKHIHHVGIYVGKGIGHPSAGQENDLSAGVVIEARGTRYGVVTSGLSRWDYWGELKAVDYEQA